MCEWQSVETNPQDQIIDTGERVIPDQTRKNSTFTEHLARYRFAQQFAKGATVLDAACGTGYGAAALAEAGARLVVGVEINQAAVSYAQKRYGTRVGVKFVQGSVAELTRITSESFDLCVSFETIEHLEEPETFLRAIHEVLSPQGRLLISTPNRYLYSPNNHDGRHSHNPYHRIEWTTEEFVLLLSRYFTVLSVYGQVFYRARVVKLHRWKEHLRRSLPQGSQARRLYTLASLRKRPPFKFFYTLCQRLMFGESMLGRTEFRNGAQPAFNTISERARVRTFSPHEVPTYSVCLCEKRQLDEVPVTGNR